MRFIPNEDGYEDVFDGEKFLPETSVDIAQKNLQSWFPGANGKQEVLLFPDEEKGSWFIQAMTGEMVTEVEFSDYRPIRRMTLRPEVEW